jgi:hypothetical protein
VAIADYQTLTPDTASRQLLDGACGSYFAIAA